jgi:RNA polymerase sigma factor (sigma-70 family)
VEATALTHSSVPGLSRPSPLLRLQSDEKLVALTRRGQHAAFETLFSRYQSRLLSFCRHMLSSKEDAEDVLQEVFTAAFNAILADEREINVRPWLYRIARNRSLNHLRRASAVGVDSMDIHFAEGGIDTGEKVMRRESFRQLIADVQQLPETQRTALLLREIDALSYEQIADAMETTVPSVKSLLVRARISLAEAAEARKLSCEEVRLELGEVAEGLAKLGAPARRHVRDCERCHDFKKHLKANNHALAAIFPIGPLFMLKKLVLTKLGSTASAGSAHVAGGAGATAGATAAAGAVSAGGTGAAGGILTAGAGALATKAVAGLAAAALVTAGAVAAEHSGQATHHHHPVATASASLPAPAAVPVVVRDQAQPRTAAAAVIPVAAIAHRRRNSSAGKPPKAPLTSATTTASTTHTASAVATTAPPVKSTPPVKPAGAAPVTQVTSETTELPSAATAQPQPSTPAAPVSTPAAGEEATQPAAPAASEEPAAATTTPSTAEEASSTPVPQTTPPGSPVEQTGGTPAPSTVTAP